MATISLIHLIRKIKKDGTAPIYIRILEGNKCKYKSTGCSVQEKYWDKNSGRVLKTHKNADVINSILTREMSQLDSNYLSRNAPTGGIKVIQELNIAKKRNKLNNFFAIASEYLTELEQTHKYSRLSTDRSRFNNLLKFVNKDVLRFEEIDVTLLRRYKVYLKSSNNCSERTVMNYFISIRTIYNRAIQAKIAKADDYPFGKGGVQIRIPETQKVGLTEEEVKRIEEADFSEQPDLDHARNLWLFSFYFAGVRISDVIRMKWSDFVDGRISYTMGKNGKIVTLKIPEKAARILAKYKEKSLELYNLEDISKKENNKKTNSWNRSRDRFVFPELEKADLNSPADIYRKTNSAICKTNYCLADIAQELGIDKKLTNHIARHTFGNITADKISPQMLQKLYRHTDIKTTMGYQSNFIHRDADDALEKVLDF